MSVERYILPFELALIRWSVVCISWNELSSHTPLITPFLTGWGWRCMGLEMPKELGTFQDSFRVGYREADSMISIKLQDDEIRGKS